MKHLLWIGLGFVVLLCAAFGSRYLVVQGHLSRDAGVIDLVDRLAGAFLAVFLIVAVQVILRLLGVRPIGSESLTPDGSGVRRGHMSYRLAWVAGMVLLCMLFFFVAIDENQPIFSSWVLILLCFGSYFAYGALWMYLYSFAYNDTYITALNLNLRARTHRWDDLVDIKDGMEAKLLVFRSTGRARIHDYAKGRDEVLAFAEEKLTDA